MAKATAEHRIMVCRRVWLPSASPHRYRARTYLWCKGDRSVKHTRAAARSRVSKRGTFSLRPRTYALHMVEKVRTEPSVAHSTLREHGTSDHAVAH